MIITKMKAGLGNQLFLYAYARTIQLKTGEKLYFDLSYYNKKRRALIKSSRKFILKNFKINIPPASEKDILLFKRNKYYKFLNALNDLLLRFRITPIKNYYINGYGQDFKFIENSIEEIIKELVVKNEILDELKDKNIYSKVTNNTTSVALHVRRGDYVKNKKFDFCNKDYFNRALEYVNNNIENPHFFIFSEDHAWCRNNLNLNGVNHTHVEEIKDDFLEFLLMSYCKNFIISNSTYSWWAAMLSNSKNKKVVAPYIWIISNYGKTLYTKNFAPKNWKIMRFKSDKNIWINLYIFLKSVFFSLPVFLRSILLFNISRKIGFRSNRRW